MGMNPETGELEEMAAAPKKRRRPRKEIRFVLVEVENTMRHLRMTTNEWALFWELAAVTDRESGQARIRTAELAEKLEVAPQNVSRLLRNLRDRNIILSEGLSVWRISPRLLTRQAVERWEKDMQDAPGIKWRP
jgi:DNA-binding transcriptional ArsR family regulator